MGISYSVRSNVEELAKSIQRSKNLALFNGIIGHLLAIAAAVGAIGVALLAAKADEALRDFRVYFVLVATLPAAVTILEKTLRPALWEEWYDKKALALSAILQYAVSANAPEGKPHPDGSLDVTIIAWWSEVNNEFEKSRPTWGGRDLGEKEIALHPPATRHAARAPGN